MFVCVTFLLLLGASSAHAQTAQEIAKKAFGSTVLLVMEDANGQPLSLGSGFFVRDGEIASNLHVVEGAARGYAKLVGQKTKYDIQGITAVDAERDLVVLKISAAGSSALSLDSSDAVQVGESVYAVGIRRGWRARSHRESSAAFERLVPTNFSRSRLRFLQVAAVARC